VVLTRVEKEEKSFQLFILGALSPVGGYDNLSSYLNSYGFGWEESRLTGLGFRNLTSKSKQVNQSFYRGLPPMRGARSNKMITIILT